MFAPQPVVDAERLAASVAAFCDRLDPESVPSPEIARVYKAVNGMQRQLAGAVLRLSRRVEASGSWRQGGDRSCEAFLARTAGTSIGAAKAQLATSMRLRELPATEDAVRSGRLSGEQAGAVADGASANPGAEQRLLDRAKVAPLSELRDDARRAKASADPDPEATHARIHATRCLRRWTDGEGAYNLAMRTTATVGADIDAALAPVIDRIFNQARKAGRHEASEAYAADALHQLVTNGCSGRPTKARESKVIALVSHDALVRRSVEDGETCELAGVGPVPVSTVEAMMHDAFLAAVVTNGVDVFNVAHLGRQPTAHQRTGLEARGYRCEVPGCGARHNLEIDHTVAWADSLRTKLDRLAWLCAHHHDLKTHHGWKLDGAVGSRTWTGPNDEAAGPDDPGPPTAALPSPQPVI